MSAFTKRRFVLAALCVWVMLSAAATSVRAAQSIPVRIVGGKLVAKGTLKSAAGEVPAHFFIELGSADSLVLHKNAIEMMGIPSGGTLEMTLGELKFPEVKAFGKDPFPETEQVSRDYAAELEETPVLGAVGLGVLNEPAIQLDLPGGFVRMGRLDEMARSEAKNVVELDYRSNGRGMLISAQLPDGGQITVQFSTSQFESLAEMDSFKTLKIGTPQQLQVRLGTLDLLPYAAWRPSGLAGIPRPLPDLVLGNDLLGRFRVIIDTENQKIRFEPVGGPVPHEAEQAYFIADNNNDAEGIEHFLDTEPSSWLRREAATRLLEIRMKRGTEAQVIKSLDLYAGAMPKDSRSQQMVVVADQVINNKDPRSVAILKRSLELATASAGDDINSSAIHQINARRGMLAMRQGNLKDARKLLLSAAFGTPGDAKVNLWLGEFYEANKQPSRAWSRYIEAALTDDAPPEALRKLEALNNDESFRQAFAIADAELLLEGRMLSYSPPRMRKPEETASVQLVELFTNATAKESLGPQLAFDGLYQFYQGTPVVFIAYHLDPPLGATVSAARGNMYGLMSPLAVMADGTAIDMNSADETAAHRLFESYQKKVAGKPPLPPVSIDATAQWKGRELEAEVKLSIDAPVMTHDLRLWAVVLERCVFMMGGNGIGLHYAVARGTMTSPEGQSLDAEQPEQTIKLSVNLDQLTRRRRAPATATAPATRPTTTTTTAPARNADGPPWMRAADPDPRELTIALIVQDAASYQVLKAIVIKPETAGAKP